MNQFISRFGDDIKNFWTDTTTEQKERIVGEILRYANANPSSFLNDIRDSQFDSLLKPLSIVLEALSHDTDKWGQFYVDTLEMIFQKARMVNDAWEILDNLTEYAYIENDEKPYIKSIVDCLCKEAESDFVDCKLAAISLLPYFVKNPIVKNKSAIISILQEKLYDKNWKVRYVAFKALGYEKLLPEGFRLAFKDRILTMILGEPPMI